MLYCHAHARNRSPFHNAHTPTQPKRHVSADAMQHPPQKPCCERCLGAWKGTRGWNPSRIRMVQATGGLETLAPPTWEVSQPPSGGAGSGRPIFAVVVFQQKAIKYTFPDLQKNQGPAAPPAKTQTVLVPERHRARSAERLHGQQARSSISGRRSQCTPLLQHNASPPRTRSRAARAARAGVRGLNPTALDGLKVQRP